MSMKDHISDFNEEKLKEAFTIKQAYSRGEIPLDLANAQMKAHVGRLTSVEIAYMEQEMQELVDDECIRESIDEMMAIYEGVLYNPLEELEDGHPIKNYFLENEAVRKSLKDLKVIVDGKYIKNQVLEELDKIKQFKIHLSRKQNQLYSMLETKGFDRPTTTMWLFDNKIRDAITELVAAVEADEKVSDIKEKLVAFSDDILDLMEKEDTILYPTSLELIDDNEFYDMQEGDKEIGYCIITPLHFDKRNTTVEEKPSPNVGFEAELGNLLSKYGVGSWTPDTVMEVSQGKLSLNQINLVFKHLPVDISYVDENELVAFYSDTKERVFPRSKGVIGRNVKNCHPKDSVYIVEDIIEKFRSGEQSRAEFWINKPGIFVYILYVAVREEDGTFKGVIEMMQDCTHIRELEGSQRLLSWETKKEDIVVEEDIQEKAMDDIEKLDPSMKVSEVFSKYPDFKKFLIEKHPQLKIMNTPMFKVMSKGKTFVDISERTGVEVSQLEDEFREFILNR